MEVALLAQKNLEMLIYMLAGFVLAKTGVLKQSAAEVLSALIIYLINPCMILVTFQRDISSSLLAALGIGFIISIGIHLLYILIGKGMQRAFNATNIERGSIVYTNCGNLLFPVISSVLGLSEAVYLMPYNIAFTIFVWTHGVGSFDKSALSIKKVLMNVNIIMIVVGFVLMLTGLRLPELPMVVVGNISNMLGPVAMIMTGIVMAGADFGKIRTFKRLPLIAVLRMIVCPAIVLFIFWITRITNLVPGHENMIMVTLLTAAAPSANMITQFAVMYGGDAEYSGAISIVTTVLCIATLPLFLYVYQLIM